MQPRFTQLQNSTPENKERQVPWQVPSRRHHVSDPRLVKNIGGILYKHPKGERYIPVCTAMSSKLCKHTFTKPKLLHTHPAHISTTLSREAEPKSQLNSVTSEVSIMSKRKSCNRRTQEKSEKDQTYGES